jgi:hypothetical protein
MSRRIDWQGVIIPRVIELLQSYDYRPTLRQIFYRLVSEQLISNTISAYKVLSRSTAEAREDGRLDPRAFEDRIRMAYGRDAGWQSPQEFLQSLIENLADRIYIKPLCSQQCRVIIWLEKDALLSPIVEITSPYRVRTYTARGYSSFSAVYEAAQELDHALPTYVLQLTDFDPSGEDMVRDLRDRLQRYGAANFEVIKIALTQRQVLDFGLPPMMAKRTDPRYERFNESHGDMAVELDALPPDTLATVITQAIEQHMDMTSWQAVLEQEHQEAEEAATLLQEMVRRLQESL